MNVSRLLLVTFIVVASAFNTGLHAQWNATAIEAETMQHFQALLRLDTTSPPGNERRAVEYLEQVMKRERHLLSGVRQGSATSQPGRAHQRQREEAANPRDGAHRCRVRRSAEMELSALWRDPRRRLCVRPRRR
jgi:hypothetical protein